MHGKPRFTMMVNQACIKECYHDTFSTRIIQKNVMKMFKLVPLKIILNIFIKEGGPLTNIPYSTEETLSPRFSRKSEADASVFLDNLEDNVPSVLHT